MTNDKIAPTTTPSKPANDRGRISESAAWYPPADDAAVDLPRPGDQPSIITDWANQRSRTLVERHGAAELHEAVEDMFIGRPDEKIAELLWAAEHLANLSFVRHGEYCGEQLSRLSESQASAARQAVFAMIGAARREVKVADVLTKLRARAADTLLEEVAAAHMREVERLEAKNAENEATAARLFNEREELRRQLDEAAPKSSVRSRRAPASKKLASVRRITRAA